jgi:isopentenyl-diphosphate delta-isomerase
MSRRKAQHLEICVDDERYAVESGRNRLGEVHLIHRSLPEVDAAAVDTSWEFLSHRVSMPLFISSMTGGSSEGYRTNKDLATIAQLLGIPVGMGSIRILFRKPEVIGRLPPETICAGCSRLREYRRGAATGDGPPGDLRNDPATRGRTASRCTSTRDRNSSSREGIATSGESPMRSPALSTDHPYPLSSRRRDSGSTPMRGVDSGKRVRTTSISPVPAGQTGCASRAYRQDDTVAAAAASEFDEWGLPVALVLATLGRNVPGVLASGGMRSGMDAVRGCGDGSRRSRNGTTLRPRPPHCGH